MSESHIEPVENGYILHLETCHVGHSGPKHVFNDSEALGNFIRQYYAQEKVKKQNPTGGLPTK